MKIAFFLATILEQGGGTQEYFITTSTKLAKEHDHKIDIISLDDRFTVHFLRYLLSLFYFKKVPKSVFYNEDLELIKTRLHNVNYIKCSSFKDLRQTLAQYDIVYSKNELLEALILKLCVGYRNLKTVIFSCMTGLRYPHPDSKQAIIRNKLYGSIVYKFLCENVVAFHVLNTADSTFLKESFPTKKIYKIYDPFNFAEFAQHSSKYPFDFTFDSTKYNIISIGRLSKQKGTDDLIKLITELNESSLKDKVVWNILGTGEEYSSFEALKAKWDNINLFGYVENKYLPSILSHMNLYISLSKMETFGFTIIESNTMGVPAISYKLPGPLELIEDKQNGYLATDYADFKNLIENSVVGKLEYGDCSTFIQTKLDSAAIYAALNQMMNDAFLIGLQPTKTLGPAIIAVIGADGVGKTTVAKRLHEKLLERGYSVNFDKRFEDYFLLRHILNAVKKRSRKISNDLLLKKTKKTPLLVKVLSPWIVYLDQLVLYFYTKLFSCYSFVITDRYPYGFLVTWRYYGFSNKLIEKIYLTFPRPNVLYILKTDAKTAMFRKKQQVVASAKHGIDYFADHVAEYDDVANKLGYTTLDSSQGVEAITDFMLEDLAKNGYIS